MPFLDGVYYPLISDTPGAHSSAGIPSLLTSPLSHSAPGMTPSSAVPAFPPFKFRPRQGSVDWRRINAVDVDFVVSQVDVGAIQEHISMVMLCSLEGERCHRCQSPVDPALLKLLQLAQLSVEWLLHCQEYLEVNLRANEERLLAAGKEREQLLAQLRKQEEGAKTLSSELKHAKKLLRTQQSLFSPHIGSLKCQLCNKSFIHSSFLQGHMQRRHPDEYESYLHSDSEKKSQIDSLKLEIGGLKEQITQQQQTLQAKAAQEKEQQFLHNNLLRELDRFKAEEMARMDRKIEDSRDGMRREMELLYSRNIQALNEVNQNQKPEKVASPVQPERDLDIYKEMQSQAMHKLELQMKKQDKKWESRLQSLKVHHESEKNQLLSELSRMQSSVSDHQDNVQRLQQEMNRRLQEKEQTIKSQREQIRSISANPPTKVIEVPVLVSAPAPEPAPKRVVVEEPASAPKLDPIQELSEEDRDSSSVSERRPQERKPEPVPEKKAKVAASSLKKNPSFKKGMRPELEQSVIKKLENLGVKPDQRGVKSRELTSILAKLQQKRESGAKGRPDYWRVREELAGSLEQTLHKQRRGSDPAPDTQARTRPLQVLQIRPRSSSLPSREPKARHGKAPQPAPRTKTQTKMPTHNMKTALKAFKANSDSENDDMDVDEEPPPKHQRGKASAARPGPGPGPPPAIQVRSGRSPATQPRHPPAWQPLPSSANTSSKPARAVDRGAAKTTPAKKDIEEEDDDEEDDEEDWSEVSELMEIDSRQLQSYKDHNGNSDKKHLESKISDLAKKMERQFTERVTKKPAGGVSILPERRDQVQELLYTDVEEGSEWGVSSSSDRQEKPKQPQGSATLRKSLDSPSTSIWGTSTGRASKSGVTEAGAGSTLKSTLYDLSDFSDSEDK